MNKVVFSLALFLFPNFLFSAGEYFPIGARAVGLANTAVAIQDSWSVFNNIAGISTATQTQAGLFYENRFSNTAFNTVALTAVQPFDKYGTAGIGVFRFGNLNYNHLRISLGFAHKIEWVSLGLQLEYAQTNIFEVGTKNNLMLNFGGMAQITSSLRFGASIRNINQAKLADYQDERLPTVMKIGLSYLVYQKLNLNAEIEKDVILAPKYKFGIEYAIIEKFKARTGINVQPFLAFFGIGYQVHQFQFDYALSYHEKLGFSHSISLNYFFGKNAKLNSEIKKSLVP